MKQFHNQSRLTEYSNFDNNRFASFVGYRRQIKYGYPAAFLNRNFGSNKGFDFFFGIEFSPDFSPIFGFLMYKSKDHTNEFFTE